MQAELVRRFNDESPARKYTPDNLLALVYSVAGTEDHRRSEISAKSNRLLNSYLNEKYKYDRYKDKAKI